MTDREIMQQALDALEYHTMQTRPISHTDKAIEALRQALAQPEQNPVRWFQQFGDTPPEQNSISTNDHLCAMLRQVHDVLACTALPMKRPWVGLTGLELNHIFAANVGYPERMCRAIEAKLKEKNCG